MKRSNLLTLILSSCDLPGKKKSRILTLLSKIPTVSSQLTHWARIPVWERWTHKYCLLCGDEDWVTGSRKTQQSKVQTSPAWSTKTSTIQTCLQTMLNLWWIVKHSSPQIVAESTPTAEFRFWSCEGKKFEAFDELKHTNSFEDCSDRPQIMWITSTFYASSYIERYDVEQFAALVDLQDFFIWSDPHATDAIFLLDFSR